MNEAIYVARDLNDPPIAFGTQYGDVVGVNPLDTYDGDSSYIEMETSVYSGPLESRVDEQVTFRLEHASGPVPPTTPVPGMELTWDFGYKFIATHGTGTPDLRLLVVHEWDTATWAAMGYEGLTQTWLPFWIEDEVSADYSLTVDRGTYLGREGADTPLVWNPGMFLNEHLTVLMLIQNSPSQFYSLRAFAATVRVTHFVARLRWPGVRPLQWRQHDFMGIAARSGTSYWRTNRARGML